VDRLNTDFAPIDQKQQHEQYCEVVKGLKLSDQHLTDIGTAVGDQVFKTVVKMLQHERTTGDRFAGMKDPRMTRLKRLFNLGYLTK
jgi:hypothetical protein